jgi:hypothetical protein
MKSIPDRNKWRPIRRTALFPALLLVLSSAGFGQGAGQQTDLVLATVRLSNAKSTATGFILSRPAVSAEGASQFLLVTAAHVLEKADGEEISIIYRRKNGDGEFARAPAPLKVRREGKPLWTQHPKQDVAAIGIEPPPGIELPRLGTDLLLTADEIKEVEPGDIVRCVGFPHASIFEPSQAAFPMVRLGCIASYPLLPIEKQPTFLVDYNAFEGDSGGPVCLKKSEPAGGKGALRILGLVHGQHFLNQRFDFAYQSGEFRKQLGLGIVVHAEAIRETIAKVP